MIRNIIILSFILLYVIYWAKFIVKNPIENDLKVICDFRINNKDFKNIENNINGNNELMILKFLPNLDIQGQNEVLSDYARSKSLTWKCPKNLHN